MQKICQKKLEEFFYGIDSTGSLTKVFLETFDIKLKTPVLDCDKWQDKHGGVHLRGHNERSAVFALLNMLRDNGFNAIVVDDGGDDNIDIVPMATAKDVMENMFGVDECRVYFKKEGFGVHCVYFVYGNAADASEVIADWGYYEDDRDGFNKLLEDFKPEDHI